MSADIGEIGAMEAMTAMERWRRWSDGGDGGDVVSMERVEAVALRQQIHVIVAKRLSSVSLRSRVPY